MKKFYASIVAAAFVFVFNPKALPANPFGTTIVKGGAVAPITLTLVGNSGGTRSPDVKGGLSLFITGGNLSAAQAIQFDLTDQPASLRFVSHAGSPRSEPSFEIVAAGGDNMKKVPKTTVRSRDARLTLVASGGGNRGRRIVARTSRGSAPITLALIPVVGGNRAGGSGALTLVITGGDLASGQAVQFDLTTQHTDVEVISTNGSNRKGAEVEIVASGGGNRKKGVAPKRSADARLTLVASGAGN
jgi:hypothetical protein